MHESERPLCLWCEERIDTANGEGFWFEPEPESRSDAEEGWYCGIGCWLSAS